MVAQVLLLGTADHPCLCETRRRKTVRPWATGRSWAFACGYPGAPARLRVRRIRMAAVPASAAPGSSGCGDEAAGTCPGSDGRKRTQSQLPQRPRQQQQQQRRASHGPRGSTVGDSRGICRESGRHDLSHRAVILRPRDGRVRTRGPWQGVLTKKEGRHSEPVGPRTTTRHICN